MHPIQPCLVRRRRWHPPVHTEEFVALRTSCWPKGSTLRVGFGTRDRTHPEWAGTRAQRALAMAGARAWTPYTRIAFVEADQGPSEIHCSFEPGSSWSFIGTEARGMAGVSMNLGWPDDPGMIVHEFGHALGLEHEQGNPNARIPWNKPYCYRLYGGAPNYWSKQDVDEQVFYTYLGPGIIATPWDKYSVMGYPITAQMVLDPAFVVGVNGSISAMDALNIGWLYL